jgi:hypothetical protein
VQKARPLFDELAVVIQDLTVLTKPIRNPSRNEDVIASRRWEQQEPDNQKGRNGSGSGELWLERIWH